MAQLPKGGLVRVYDNSIHGSCAIYFPGGINRIPKKTSWCILARSQLCVKFTHWGHRSWMPKSSNHFTFSGANQPTIAPLSHSSKEEKKMKRKAKEEELQPGLWSRLNKSHVTYSPNDSCLWFLYKFSGGLLSSQLRLINIPLRLSWWFGIYCFTYSISLNVFVWCDFLGSLKSKGD